MSKGQKTFWWLGQAVVGSISGAIFVLVIGFFAVDPISAIRIITPGFACGALGALITTWIANKLGVNTTQRKFGVSILGGVLGILMLIIILILMYTL